MQDPQPGGSEDRPAGTVGVDWQAALAQHQRWLRTVVHARLGDPAAAEEVLQEVALAAVRQAAPLEDPEKVAPWLYRLAVRQVLLYRRRRGRQRKLTERFAERYRPTEQDSRAPDPLDWLLLRERRQSVRLALDRLPAGDAQLLLLKYTENWSYHDLARHLGVSHAAVESRLHRARARLRAELAAAEVVEVKQ